MHRIALLAASLLSLTACFGDRAIDVGVAGGVTEPALVDTGMEGVLGSDWAQVLHLRTGCSDTTLHLWNESQEVGLTVVAPGLLERAAGHEGPYSETLEIGDSDVQVFLEMATPIADNYCSDALVEREVFETWEATEGAVVLELSPPGDATADVPVSLDLWNIRLEDSDGRRVSETHLEVDDIPVTQVWGG